MKLNTIKIMKRYLIIALVIKFSFCFGQTPSTQSNSSINFNSFLNGVRYAFILLPTENKKYIENTPNSGNAFLLAGLIKYLNNIGFENVQWGDASNLPQNMPSICELCRIYYYFTIADQRFSNIQVDFVTCNNDYFRFNVKGHVNVDDNIKNVFYNKLLETNWTHKQPYNPNYQLKLRRELSEWNEVKLKAHFTEKGSDEFEGIYENTNHTYSSPKYKVGVVKRDDAYNLIYLSGAMNYNDWQEGEIKSKLSATATTGIFKADWTMLDKTINKDFYITFDNGSLKVKPPIVDADLYLKLFPSSVNKNIKKGAASGTGFAISSNGLIATCNHVIDNANNIIVRGINNNFEVSYKAKIVVTDKNNDLAIIQIVDSGFKTIGIVPFIFADKTIEVGSTVFALGYPLRSTMGDEIKLTNGIVSSKSGFQGDITAYQISVPVQPGNSGGPLFDDNGNLVGIVNAKHLGAENASYAIKTSYLKNLIESITPTPKISILNTLSTKSLPDKVKVVKNYTYIIETN